MKPVNFEVFERPGDTNEKMIKRFLKKTTKTKIVQTYLEKMYFKSKSSQARKKKIKKNFIKRKIQEAYEAGISSEN